MYKPFLITAIPPTFPTVSQENQFSLRSIEKITMKFLAHAAFTYAEIRKKNKFKFSFFSLYISKTTY